jgi:hypothetical protein
LITCRKKRIQPLEDGHVVVDGTALVLGDAFRDPGDVSHLLLLEADVGVKDAVRELNLKGVLVELHLVLKEGVFERLAAVEGDVVEERPVGRVALGRGDDTRHVLSPSEPLRALGPKEPKLREELDPAVAGELRAEAVDGDVDGPPVGLKGQHLGHHLCRRVSEGRRKLDKVLQVGLPKNVPDHLRIVLVQILALQALGKVRLEMNE